MPGSLTLLRSNTTHFGQGSNGTAGNMPMYQLSSSIGDMALGENRHGQGAEDTKKEDEHEEEDNDDDDDDEDDDETDDDGIEDFTPPKYIVDEKPKTPVVSPPPPTPLAMRKVGRPNSVSTINCCLLRAPNQSIQTPDQHRTTNANRLFSPIDAGSINH